MAVSVDPASAGEHRPPRPGRTPSHRSRTGAGGPRRSGRSPVRSACPCSSSSWRSVPSSATRRSPPSAPTASTSSPSRRGSRRPDLRGRRAAVGTIEVGLIALAVAVPVGVGAALFISEYAPRSLKRSLVSLVDLMAAVPGIVFGMWALFFLQRTSSPSPTRCRSTSARCSRSSGSSTPDSPLVVHLVGVHRRDRRRRRRAAHDHLDHARGLRAGADRGARGRARARCDPLGGDPRRGPAVRSRAASSAASCSRSAAPSARRSWSTRSSPRPSASPPGTLQSGTNTIASHIASRYSESNGLALSALLGAGLVLFLFTLVINTLAGVVVSRSRSGAATEI